MRPVGRILGIREKRIRGQMERPRQIVRGALPLRCEIAGDIEVAVASDQRAVDVVDDDELKAQRDSVRIEGDSVLTAYTDPQGARHRARGRPRVRSTREARNAVRDAREQGAYQDR